MAQGRVTEFFSSRKRSVVPQPSKRRKVQRVADISQESLVLENEVNSAPKTRARAKLAVVFDAPVIDKAHPKMAAFAGEKTPTTRPAQGTPPTRKTRKPSARKARQTTRTRAGKSVEDTAIGKAFENAGQKKASSSKEERSEEITKTTDDTDNNHPSNSPPCTPTKRQAEKTTKSEVARKRKKLASTSTEPTIFDDMKQGTPKKGFTFRMDEADGVVEQECITAPVRRKLAMRRGKKTAKEADNTPSTTVADQAQQKEQAVETSTQKCRGKTRQNASKEHQTVSDNLHKKKSPDTTNENGSHKEDVAEPSTPKTPSVKPAKSKALQLPSTPVAQPKRPSVTMTPSPCTPSQSPGGSRTPLSDRVREAIRQGSLSPSPKLTASAKKEMKESQTPSKRSAGISELQRRLARVQEEAAKVKAKEKTMTRAELREKLIQSGQLSSLQQHMKAIQDGADKLKADKSKQKQVPSSSNKETTQESNDHKVAPAYERHHHLTTAVPPPPSSLGLPYQYKLLAEMFRSLDTVVSILHNREELATFQKLKNAVQEMCRKKFETHHVGQIKTVFPSAYVFRQEKMSQSWRNQGDKGTQYQLTVQANLDNGDPQKSAPQAKVSFSSSQLINRRNIFQTNLVNIVKDHHRRFIQNLAPSPSVCDDSLTKWHPKFPLDKMPDIEPSPLPQPPNIQKYSTAQDVLDQARGRKILPKVEKALQKVAQLSPKETEKPKTVSNTASSSSTSGHKGAPLSLLERIRAKEAARAEKYMTRDADHDRKTAMIGRLPDLARILRAHFVTEKKSAVPIESAVKKMSESYRSVLSSTESEAHLKLLTELAPGWLSVVKISKGTYLKMDKNQDMNIIVDKLDKALKESM